MTSAKLLIELDTEYHFVRPRNFRPFRGRVLASARAEARLLLLSPLRLAIFAKARGEYLQALDAHN